VRLDNSDVTFTCVMPSSLNYRLHVRNVKSRCASLFVIQTYKIDVKDDQGNVEQFSYTSHTEDYIRKQIKGFHRGAVYTFSLHADVQNYLSSPPIAAVIRK